MDQAMPSVPGRFALMNQKGGVGKTTTTVNLAAAMAELGERVLVVDLDPQAHATLHLGVDPDDRPTALDVLEGDVDDPGAACVEVADRLSLLPSETDLASVEGGWAEREGAQVALKRALDRLGERFTRVLIDCPPSLGLLTINGLCAADAVIVPMQAHFLALQGLSKLLETVSALRGGLNPALRVSGVVLCMHDKQATHTQEVVRDLEAFFEASKERPEAPWSGGRIYEPAIRRNIKLAECPSFGQTIFQYAPLAPGAEDYLALARDVLGMSTPAPGGGMGHVDQPMEAATEPPSEPPAVHVERVEVPRAPVDPMHGDAGAVGY